MSTIPGIDLPGTSATHLPESFAIRSAPRREVAEANLLNLLIVDDERSIRDGCKEVAQALGFTTYIADNAEHAFRVI